ncbi:ankyrin repeat domain-containing protein [Candidatus Bathyarchaeota archaeon]|nr:MAG: ankyrin repeat domain-containing protein [Candidatus Bathyarchaeota archaeon]TMI58705.1 MAG: ankyrin repeat domain-containing protein [Candidatus Bathyarchaeota archaeon]
MVIARDNTSSYVQTTNTPLSTDLVREFVIAGHGNLEKVRKMLEERPDLLNAAYAWTENDHETAIQAAAQVGSVPVAEYLLEKGAPLEICTAAMLGRKEEVERRIRENPGNINSTGAHDITLLTHAALSGDIELVQYLFQNGAKTGSSSALQTAVTRGYYDLIVWLIENASPDLNAKNFQGKTPLSIAIERKQEKIAQLLKNHDAGE